MWPKTPVAAFIWVIAICAGVAILSQTGLGDWLSDTLISPGSRVPDVGDIDVPGVR